MAQHGRNNAPRHTGRGPQQVVPSGSGPRASRDGRRVQRDFVYAENIARRARVRRIVVIAILAVFVLALALGAGMLAFRGVVSSQLSLRDSDADKALSQPRSSEMHYILMTVELGSVAYPLDNGGPDVILLACVNPEARSLALVSIPATLQITTDNKSDSIATLAQKGDAALIDAIETFMKIDVHHFVKVDEKGFVDLVDALGGIDVTLDQVIDDPQAGSLYLEAGEQTLDGAAALVYLRATNVRMGAQDRLDHQLDFAALVLDKIFNAGGSFHSRLEAIGPLMQTDMTLADIESLGSLVGDQLPDGIVRTVLPGYTTEVTDVEGTFGGRYIGTSSDAVEMLEKIQNGEPVTSTGKEDAKDVNPAGFTIEVQNGTTINGAAGKSSEILTSAGFTVTETGNAEQPIYEETLVVYQDDEENGPAEAQAVIDALGIGRAVPSGIYYSFETDILVIIGTDYKPTS